jgi:hypothetical protein
VKIVDALIDDLVAVVKPRPLIISQSKERSVMGDCPKCGNRVIKTRYCKGWGDCPRLIPGEHLEKTCQVCGYQWHVETLDKQRSPYQVKAERPYGAHEKGPIIYRCRSDNPNLPKRPPQWY